MFHRIWYLLRNDSILLGTGVGSSWEESATTLGRSGLGFLYEGWVEAPRLKILQRIDPLLWRSGVNKNKN